MFNKKNTFTLIELIVVIAILGILSTIVIPNISKMDKKAKISAMASNIKIMQTAVDAYKMDNGNYPTTKQPTIEEPELIDINKLYPNYLKSYPDIVGEDYWVDFLGTVWGSESETVNIKGQGTDSLSWETVPTGVEYKLFEVIDKKDKKELKTIGVFDNKSKLFNKLDASRKDLDIISVNQGDQLIKLKSDPQKQYLVSARDDYGFFTAPVGASYTGDTDIEIEKDQTSRTLYINTFAYDVADWISISKKETIHEGTSISYEFAHSKNGEKWSNWYSNIEEVPDDVALRIKITLTREVGKPSPILHSLKVNYIVNGKPSECKVNLFKSNEMCETVLPNYPEKPFIPEIPPIVLPNGGDTSQKVEIPSDSIVTDIIPDYDISNGGSNQSKPDISFDVSTDGGNTWTGPYDNIVDVPNKDKITDVEIDYTFPTDTEVTIKPPIISTTDSTNSDKVDTSINKPTINGPDKPDKPEDGKPEESTKWIVVENFDLIENHNETVEWLSVDVKQSKANSELGRLTVYLSTSDNGSSWTEEVQGAENVSSVSNSSHLKVRILSEHSEKGIIEDAPLFEEITVKSKKLNGEVVENSYQKDPSGNIQNTTPKFSLGIDLNNLTTEDAVNLEVVNGNPNLTISNIKWLLDNKEITNTQNVKFEVGSHNLKTEISYTTINNVEKKHIIETTFEVTQSIPEDKVLSNKVFLGKNSSYVVDQSGLLYSFGNNTYGQLGIGNNTKKSSPTLVSTLSSQKIKDLCVNPLMSKGSVIAVMQTGEVYSWGDNTKGQLGLGNNTNQTNPTLISSLTNKNIKKTKMSYNGAAFALTQDGKMYSWGNNEYGQLGHGGTENINEPKLIEGLTNIKDFSVGSNHIIALTDSGELYAWGYNVVGQLGLGDMTNKDIPYKISGFEDKEIKELFTDVNSTYLLLETGELYSWGYNDKGQLGLGHKTNMSTPQKIEAFGDEKIQQFEINTYSAFAKTQSGKIYTWGGNHAGQLGLGDKVNRETPELFTKLNSSVIKEIITNGASSYAITDSGKVYSWGYNNFGQLGVGHTSAVLDPQLIVSLNGLNIEGLYSEDVRTFAVTQDGKIYSWGSNTAGELGVGDLVSKYNPQLIKF